MAIFPWPSADLSLIPNPESSRLHLRPPSQPPCPPVCVSPYVDGFVVNSTADLIEQRLKKKMTNWWKYSSPTRCTPRPQKAPGPHFENHCVNHLIYLCTVSHPFPWHLLHMFFFIFSVCSSLHSSPYQQVSLTAAVNGLKGWDLTMLGPHQSTQMETLLPPGQGGVGVEHHQVSWSGLHVNPEAPRQHRTPCRTGSRLMSKSGH